MTRVIGGLIAIAVMAIGQPLLAAESSPATFGWFAELVSFDPAARTMTAKAPFEPHVARYIGSFAPGDRVVLVWTQFGGEADAVRYIAREAAMDAESGYVVRARFVGADAAAGTITFATPVPDGVARTLATARPGTPVRVGAPTLQPGPDAVLASVALDKMAPPRPEPVVEAPPEDNSRKIADPWTVDTSLMGNAAQLKCVFTQEGPTLGGTCNGPGPLANLAVTGNIDGDDVTFAFEISSFGPTITLLHKGTLDADGTSIKGTLNLMGTDSEFTAIRGQP